VADDLFPADNPSDAQPASDPAGDPSGNPTPSPAGDALSGTLERITSTLEGLSGRLAAIESRSAAPAQPTASVAPAAPADPQAAFNAMYADPATFVREQASGVVQQQLNDFASKLTPFFGTVADQLAQRGTDAARTQFDESIGAGAFDKLVGDDLAVALAQLAPAQRADANYVRALAAGVLGGKMLSPEGQKEVREVMAAARQRPAAPVVLTGNRSPAPADRLSEADRELIARVSRSTGIRVDEKSFLENRNRERTEEAFGATWMNPPAPRRPNGAAK
jgi:hypothetical protein